MVAIQGSGNIWTGPIRQTIAICDRGLMCGNATILVRMIKSARGRPCLALDADADRLDALLSVAVGEPVRLDRMRPAIEAASGYWRIGDKALANLRLAFADLPRVDDQAALRRLRTAEDLLDGGYAPNALMKALWPLAALSKYARDQARVPAGSGPSSGEWTVALGVSAGIASLGSDRIIVAEGQKEATPEASSSEIDEITGHHPPNHGAAWAELPDPLSGLPGGVGPGPFAGRSIPAGPSVKPSAKQQLRIDEIGRETGCHTCGRKDSGLPNGNFIGDHQSPKALNPEGADQSYLPHCKRCSSSQGGLITNYKLKGR